MSWEDTSCPCGGRKDRETMLCVECQTQFKDRPETKELNSDQLSFSQKRSSAIALLALARRRRKGGAQRFAPQSLQPPAPGANVAPLERSGRE